MPVFGSKGKTAALPSCPEKPLPLCLCPSLGECQCVEQPCLETLPMVLQAGQGWGKHCAQLCGVSPHLLLDIPGLDTTLTDMA